MTVPAKRPDRPRHSVSLLLDRELQARLRMAEERLAARLAEHDGEARRVGGLRRAGYDDAEVKKATIEALAKAEADVAAMRAEAEAKSTRFTFVALPAAEKRKLRDAHPPTDEQVAEAKAEAAEGEAPDLPAFDDETYWPAYLEASCVEPELPPGWWGEALDEDGYLSDAELAVLLSHARQANFDVTVADWGKGSSETLNLRPSSPTASPAESPTPVSWPPGEEPGAA